MGRKPKQFLLNGKESTVIEAAAIIGCTPSAIYDAIRGKRFYVANYSVCWADNIKPVNKKRNHYKACLIDGDYFKSVAIAARHYGFIVESLCHALDMHETFKGHSIAWAEEE